METKAVFVILCFLCSPFLPQLNAETIVVDELAKLNSPSIHVGDSLVFKHNGLYGLYIFRSKRAFDLCNFLQATPLLDNNDDKNSYIFKPSRPGYYYFSYSNETNANLCLRGEKLAVRVLQQKPPENMVSPSPAAAPPRESGSTFRSSPALPWRVTTSPPATPPARSPVPSAGGIQFITSNPAVPLPTGETDTSIIQPLAMSGRTGCHSNGIRWLQVRFWIVIALWGGLFYV